MRVASLAASILAMTVTAAAASDASVVILDVQGDVTPSVDAFDELPAGTTLSLGAGTVLQLGHYATCAEVTVKGGTISIETDRVMFDGNESVTQDGETCVSNVTIAAADIVSASIVTRSSNIGTPLIAPRPAVAVGGPDGPGYTTLTVMAGSETVLSAPIVDRRAVVPADAAPLEPGKTVTLIINGPTVQQHAARAVVAEDAAGWVVLRK
ncbi:MAG: hypothetical protein AAFV19_10700 [Pseudomonadota bacterium]